MSSFAFSWDHGRPARIRARRVFALGRLCGSERWGRDARGPRELTAREGSSIGCAESAYYSPNCLPGVQTGCSHGGTKAQRRGSLNDQAAGKSLRARRGICMFALQSFLRVSVSLCETSRKPPAVPGPRKLRWFQLAVLRQASEEGKDGGSSRWPGKTRVAPDRGAVEQCK
jgi:hypothetical protein